MTKKLSEKKLVGWLDISFGYGDILSESDYQDFAEERQAYQQIRQAIQRKVSREKLKEWKEFIMKCGVKSAMQAEYIVREIWKELGYKVEE